MNISFFCVSLAILFLPSFSDTTSKEVQLNSPHQGQFLFSEILTRKPIHQVKSPGVGQLAFFQRPKLLEVPSVKDRSTALKTIKDIFKSEYASRIPQERKKLAELLLKQATEDNDPVTKYVFLTEAIDISTNIGDPETAFSAINILAKHYQVDELDLKIDTLYDLSRKARTPEANKFLLRMLSPMISKSKDQNRFTETNRLLTIGMSLAKKARDINASNQLTKQKKELVIIQKQFKTAQEAYETLKKDPSDEKANLQIGEFLAFSKKQFEKALPYFARSSDDDLSKLAIHDLEQPTSPQEQTKLANAWYEYGMSQRDPKKLSFLSRASYWYSTALPKLTEAVEKIKVGQKLKEINKLGASQAGDIKKILMSQTWSVKWESGTAYEDMKFLKTGKTSFKVSNTGSIENKNWKINEQNDIVVEYAPTLTVIYRLKSSESGWLLVGSIYAGERLKTKSVSN